MKVEREGESVVCPLLIFLKMELPAEPEGGWERFRFAGTITFLGNFLAVAAPRPSRTCCRFRTLTSWSILYLNSLIFPL